MNEFTTKNGQLCHMRTDTVMVYIKRSIFQIDLSKYVKNDRNFFNKNPYLLKKDNQTHGRYSKWEICEKVCCFEAKPVLIERNLRHTKLYKHKCFAFIVKK